jgi:DNA-binding beta-propeller fold protein YncE
VSRRRGGRHAALLALAVLTLLVALPSTGVGVLRFDREWKIPGAGTGEAGIAVDRAGSVVYFADPFFGGTGRVLAYSRDGTLLRTLDKANGVDVERPLGVAVDSAGNLHVYEGDRNRVLVLSPTGSPVRTVVPTGDAVFDELAQGIALDAQDNLYVADTRNSRIEVFDTRGALVRRFGLGGNFVDDVAVDASGNVYALLIFGTGGCESAVQKHAADGTLLARWNVTQAPAFSCARFGMAIDPRTGELLVASQSGSAPGVRRYSPTGALVGAPLGGNDTPGDISQPVGVAIDAAGTVFVRDVRGLRVLRFADLPPAPNLQNTIPSPKTISVGPATVIAPGKISLRSLRRSKCLRTLVLSSRPARVNVRIFSGTRSIRLFGAKRVLFRAAGRKVVCIAVPFRAKTFDARTRLRITVAVALGTGAGGGGGGPAPKPPRPATREISLVP